MTNTYVAGRSAPTANKSNTLFYHGTTSTLPIKRYILPSTVTGVRREDWRAKLTDKVFLTTSLLSAWKYAHKACVKYGGSPVVYAVTPIGICYNTVNTEHIADRAKVFGKIERCQPQKIGNKMATK